MLVYILFFLALIKKKTNTCIKMEDNWSVVFGQFRLSKDTRLADGWLTGWLRNAMRFTELTFCRFTLCTHLCQYRGNGELCACLLCGHTRRPYRQTDGQPS